MIDALIFSDSLSCALNGFRESVASLNKKHNGLLEDEFGSYVYWRKGTRLPRLSSVVRIAEACGCSLEEAMFSTQTHNIRLMSLLLPNHDSALSGHRAKSLRTLFGLQQASLGSMLGIGASNVRLIESYKKPFSLREIYAYCLYFRVSPDWLLFGKDESAVSDKDVYVALGSAVADITDEKGLSVSILSERVGVTSVTIYNWINGDSQPRKKSFPVLCSALNIEPGILIDRVGYFLNGHSIFGETQKDDAEPVSSADKEEVEADEGPGGNDGPISNDGKVDGCSSSSINPCEFIDESSVDSVSPAPLASNDSNELVGLSKYDALFLYMVVSQADWSKIGELGLMPVSGANEHKLLIESMERLATSLKSLNNDLFE